MTTYLALPANDDLPWYEWGTQKIQSLLKTGDGLPPPQPGDVIMRTEDEGEQRVEGGEQGGEGGEQGEQQQQDDPTARLLEATRERERLAQAVRGEQPAMLNPDGTPVTELGGIQVVAGSEGEDGDTDSEDDVASDEDQGETAHLMANDDTAPVQLSGGGEEEVAMDIGSALASSILMTANTKATIAKISKMKESLAAMKSKSRLSPMSHNLRTSPLLKTVSRANSTPRLVDNITFRNAYGAKLYSDARAQLEPYATVTFADALASGAVSPHQLVYSSMMLAASMREGVKFTDSLYNYTPGKQTARSRTVTVAASQLGQSMQHAVIPATQMFMQAGQGKTTFFGGVKKTVAKAVNAVKLIVGPRKTEETGVTDEDDEDPISPDEQVSLVQKEKAYEEKEIALLADRDQFGNINYPSLRHGRGRQSVLWENIAKATIRLGVGYYRDSDDMQKTAARELERNDQLFIDFLMEAKLLNDKMPARQVEDVIVDRARLDFDQIRSLIGAAVPQFPNKNLESLDFYSQRRLDRTPIENTAGVVKFNRKNDRNVAERENSAQIGEILGLFFGDVKVAQYWWKLYTDAEMIVWKVLAAEGESSNFEIAMRRFIYLCYQIGYMIDGRTRIFLQVHADTYDEELYRKFKPNCEEDECCPHECDPEPCEPKCVTRYVYIQPSPCVEIVDPDCVDETCMPHCVEPCAPPPPPCAPKPACPPTQPAAPCAPDPCDLWHDILVPVKPDCGPPCEMAPDVCMKSTCEKAFGINASSFMLKAGCDEDECEVEISPLVDELCCALKCYVNTVQQPRSADQRVAQAAAMAGKVISSLNNSGTHDQLHMFSTALKQMMWILFKTLYCNGSCRARVLIHEIASFMYLLSNFPNASGDQIVATKETLPVVNAFTLYLKGDRDAEWTRKFQLIEQDAPFMLPDQITSAEALYHTLRGALDAVQDSLKSLKSLKTLDDKEKEIDSVEIYFIRGEWDYVYKRMKDKLGAAWKPEIRTYTGEKAPKEGEKPTPLLPPKTQPPPPAVLPPPLKDQPPSTATAPAGPVIPPPPPAQVTPPAQVIPPAEVTQAAPMIITKDKVGALSSNKVRLTSKSAPLNANDDDEFAQKAPQSLSKEPTAEELLAQYS